MVSLLYGWAEKKAIIYKKKIKVYRLNKNYSRYIFELIAKRS
jgi:hypothetical protein